LFAHQHLVNHGYSKVSSYATHPQLGDSSNKGKKEKNQEALRIYGCGVQSFLTETPRSLLFAPYRQMLTQCESNLNNSSNNTNTNTNNNQQRLTSQPNSFQLNSRGLFNILNYIINPPPTALTPLMTLQRQAVNLPASKPQLVKFAPTLFQTAFNFTLGQHKRFSNTLHPLDMTNPTSNSFLPTACNHISWVQNNPEGGNSNRSSVSHHPLHPQNNSGQVNTTQDINTFTRDPFGPHLATDVTGEEPIPPFEIIFTYEPHVFTHVVDILHQYHSTMQREIHVINIPTKDDPTDVRIAGELTLVLLNALHLSLDRSSHTLSSHPIGRIDPETKERQIVFKPLNLGGDDNDGNNDIGGSDAKESSMFEEHLNPFLAHQKGIMASTDKAFSSFWNGANIEAILSTVEESLGEKILHCMVWL
jgi:hypothetical protein